MSWQRIAYMGDAVCWINGIYKVVSYREGEFLAYYMPDHFENWGNHVATPPDTGKNGGKCWRTLKAAQAACSDHAQRHTPAPRTVKRAATVLAELVRRAA